MPDTGEKGNQSTTQLREVSLSSFRIRRDEDLKAAKNVPKGICIKCGKPIEEGRFKIGLHTCKDCGFNQSSSSF